MKEELPKGRKASCNDIESLASETPGFFIFKARCPVRASGPAYRITRMKVRSATIESRVTPAGSTMDMSEDDLSGYGHSSYCGQAAQSMAKSCMQRCTVAVMVTGRAGLEEFCIWPDMFVSSA
jgi:hypothetical protein